MQGALAQMRRLALAFPRDADRFSNEGLQLFAEFCADIPPEVLAAVVDELIATRTFMPAISEIRNAAAERVLALPSEQAALAQIETRIAWAATSEDARSPEPPVVHPLVKEALNLVGGYHAYKAADNPSVLRGQFLNLYRQMRSEAVKQAVVAPRPELPSAPARGALSA